MMPTENQGKTFIANSAGLSADALQCVEILEKKCRAGEISLSDVQLKQFAAYFDLLTETNKVMNLTALISPEDVAVKHFIDSLLCYDERLMKGKTVIDVGTGAGFPGIPLKIYDPSIKLVLLDSLAKRLSFLEKVTEQLRITGVRFEHMRAEDAGHSKVLRGKFDVAVSRAARKAYSSASGGLPRRRGARVYPLPSTSASFMIDGNSAGSISESLFAPWAVMIALTCAVKPSLDFSASSARTSARAGAFFFGSLFFGAGFSAAGASFGSSVLSDPLNRSRSESEMPIRISPQCRSSSISAAS